MEEQVTIAAGGVLPNIHSALLPKDVSLWDWLKCTDVQSIRAGRGRKKNMERRVITETRLSKRRRRKQRNEGYNITNVICDEINPQSQLFNASSIKQWMIDPWT